MDVAKGLERFINTMMETQLDCPSRMFTVYSRAHGFHTDPDLGDGIRYVLNQGEQKRDQSCFHPSIAGCGASWPVSTRPRERRNGLTFQE